MEGHLPRKTLLYSKVIFYQSSPSKKGHFSSKFAFHDVLDILMLLSSLMFFLCLFLDSLGFLGPRHCGSDVLECQCFVDLLQEMFVFDIRELFLDEVLRYVNSRLVGDMGVVLNLQCRLRTKVMNNWLTLLNR